MADFETVLINQTVKRRCVGLWQSASEDRLDGYTLDIHPVTEIVTFGVVRVNQRESDAIIFLPKTAIQAVVLDDERTWDDEEQDTVDLFFPYLALHMDAKEKE